MLMMKILPEQKIQNIAKKHNLTERETDVLNLLNKRFKTINKLLQNYLYLLIL